VGIRGVEAAQQGGVRCGQLRLHLAQGDEQLTAGRTVQADDGRVQVVERGAGRRQRLRRAVEATADSRVEGVATGVRGVHRESPPWMDRLP